VRSTKTQANSLGQSLGQSVRKAPRVSRDCEGKVAHRANAARKANAAPLDSKANAVLLDRQAIEGCLDRKANAVQLDHQANEDSLERKASQGQPPAVRRADSCCAFSVASRRSRATPMKR
jgi:hypothetical protein